MPLFEKIRDEEYVCSVWFERDRKNVTLETPKGRVVFSLIDEEVDEAITDGFLTTPRHPRPRDADWHPHALAYARNQGLIK